MIPSHVRPVPRARRLTFTCLVFTLSFVAAMSCFAATAGAQALKKITLVQMHPVIGVGEDIFLYAVPKRLGYFKAEGLEVESQTAQNGVVAAQVLQSNGAQVGTTAPEAVMLTREQGGDLVAFHGLKRNPGTFVVVLDESPIRKLEDLKGKTIGASSFGAGGGLALKTNLSEMGITPEQYTAIATGAGPSAVAALKSGKLDAVVMWDAMLAAAENTGLKLRLVDIPFQSRLAGMTLATSQSFAKSNPEAVAGYCRAMTKALVFTKTNPEAAVRIFWEEFPSTRSATLDDATALKYAVHILNRFLEMALYELPDDAKIGDFVTASWTNSHAAFTTLGTLKGTGKATDAYTTQFLAACNDFDRAAIVAQANATPR